MKVIDKDDNQTAGSRLQSDFYNPERIIDTDDFFVDVYNADGTPYKGEIDPSGVAEPVVYHTCPGGEPPVVRDVSTKAAPDQTFLDYARTTPDGWTGGDSTYSVRLPNGKILWLFSDTFLGPLNANGTRPTSAKLINSSFMAQNGTTLSTVTVGQPCHARRGALPRPWDL